MAINQHDTDPALNQLFITRPILRDAIRRKRGLTPPGDNMDGVGPGVTPRGESYPSDILVNQCIADAIRKINRTAKFHMQTITIPVALTTSTGPQFIPLTGHVQGQQAVINDVRRVTWTPTGGTSTLLLSDSYFDMDRRRFNQDTQSPGTPTRYFVAGYQMAIVPGASVAGSLLIYAGTGLIGLATDYDTLDGIPTDYQEVIEDIAVLRLLEIQAQQQGGELAAAQIPMLTLKEKQGLDEIVKWVASVNATQQPRLIFGRNYYYRR